MKLPSDFDNLRVDAIDLFLYIKIDIHIYMAEGKPSLLSALSNSDFIA